MNSEFFIIAFLRFIEITDPARKDPFWKRIHNNKKILETITAYASKIFTFLHGIWKINCNLYILNITE